VGLAALADVDDGAGPQTVDLAPQLAFQAGQEARLGADEAQFLADQVFGAGGEEGGLAQPTQGEIEHRRQVAGVGLAMAQMRLLPGQLDLISISISSLYLSVSPQADKLYLSFASLPSSWICVGRSQPFRRRTQPF
jgi:hypothetical protein